MTSMPPVEEGLIAIFLPPSRGGHEGPECFSEVYKASLQASAAGLAEGQAWSRHGDEGEAWSRHGMQSCILVTNQEVLKRPSPPLPGTHCRDLSG